MAMFELRVYCGANPPIVSYHVNAFVPMAEVVRVSTANGVFSFTRAECWWNGVRQWELMID